jgi:HSP20 family protein
MFLQENFKMNLQKLNPWNWFKHEEDQSSYESTIPVKKNDYAEQLNNRNPILELHSEIDKLFDRAFQGFGLSPLFKTGLNEGGLLSKVRRSTLFVPDLNVSSDDKEYTIILEAAGLEQKDISIDLTDRRLVIKGNKQEEIENKDKDFYRIERKFGSFQRILAVPEDAVVDGIKATMKNGLLTVKIPRAENQPSNSKKIEIENS